MSAIRSAWPYAPPPASGASATPFPVPGGLQLMAGIRPDLRALDLSHWMHRLALYLWWESPAHEAYADQQWHLSAHDLEVLSRTDWAAMTQAGLAPGASIVLKGNWPTVLDLVAGFRTHACEAEIGIAAFRQAVPPALQWIWQDRADLHAAYDLATPHGRTELLKWWFLHGHREYTRIIWRVQPDCLELLRHGPRGQYPLPAFLSAIVSGRDDIRPLYDLETETGWLSSLQWWSQSGHAEYGVPAWSLPWHTELRRELHRIATSFNAREAGAAQELPYLAFALRQMRPDLRTAFDVSTPEGCARLQAWWASNGEAEHAVLTALFADPDRQVPGVNVVGYAQGVIGISEDVRMAVRSLSQVHVPVAVMDAPMSGPPPRDHTLDDLLTTQPVHPFSLYCLPPSELGRLALEGGARLLRSGTCNIGLPPWELPLWPRHLAGLFDELDEVWACTEFIRQAIAPLTSRPVLKMPLAVEVDTSIGPNRAALGLPQKGFLFLVMFDGKSWLSRKNPLAAVHAFMKAFPRNRHVGLVIKAMGLDRSSAGWQAVETAIRGDKRVTVIDTVLSRSELTCLTASCDAYVSLHRAEGFGRIIAETMLLGVPTVTTNFSGNVDYCLPSTSYLVEGPLVPLRRDDYIFTEGQHWCDPDIDQAAQQLRRLFEDKAHTRTLVRAARERIRTHYSPAAAGSAYRARLLALQAGH